MSKLVTLLSVMLTQGRDDKGQGLAEYALILSLIAIVAIVGVLFLGNALSGQLTTIGNAVSSANP